MNIVYLKKSIFALLIVCLIFVAPAVLAGGLFENMKTAAGTDLAKNADLLTYIGVTIKAILLILSVALAMVLIYAGITIGFLSAFEPKKVQAAKEMILYAVIGLVIVFASWAISTFLLGLASNTNPRF